MRTVLVTGSTGTLGRHLVPLLEGRGYEVRTLSRRAGRATHTGDLTTGKGVLAAADGADLVVHAASDSRHFGRTDPVQTRHLLDATTGAAHLLYPSIVGVDLIPVAYYRRKLACEELLGRHRVPYTILRVTQFHELIAGWLRATSRLPIAALPLDFRFQSVAAADVAGRIADLIGDSPLGRADDYGGPEILTLREMVGAWQRRTWRARPLVRLPIPGRVGDAFRLGRNTAPGHGSGLQTWAEFLRATEPARIGTPR